MKCRVELDVSVVTQISPLHDVRQITRNYYVRHKVWQSHRPVCDTVVYCVAGLCSICIMLRLRGQNSCQGVCNLFDQGHLHREI